MTFCNHSTIILWLVLPLAHAFGNIPALHNRAGACCGNAGPNTTGGTGGGTCIGID